MPLDAGEVNARGLAKPVDAEVGGNGEQPAGVVQAGLTPHQTVTFESVDQAGEPAAREQDAVGEFGHAQPTQRRLGQLHQHVVRRERQLVGSGQLAFECAQQLSVRPQERTPHRKRFGGGSYRWCRCFLID